MSKWHPVRENIKRKKQMDLAQERFRHWITYSNPKDLYDDRSHKLAVWWSNAVCDDEDCACFDIDIIDYQIRDGKMGLSAADKYIINRYGDMDMMKQSVNQDIPTPI